MNYPMNHSTYHNNHITDTVIIFMFNDKFNVIATGNKV